MKIERIISKNDKNVIVYLEDGEKLFLSKEVVLKNGLRKGDFISDDLSSFLIKENQLFLSILVLDIELVDIYPNNQVLY